MDPALFEHLLIGCHLVLPALVGARLYANEARGATAGQLRAGVRHFAGASSRG